MKKLMMIGSALLVLSTSVFATEARLLALGMKETDNDGSYYIQDSRNIFLNAANVNNFADMLITEWGSAGRTVGAKATVDTVPAPKAQGGVLKRYGGLVYGAYFGNESNTSALLRIAGSNLNTALLQTTDNQIDLFVGGEAAVKWGANVLYAKGKDETVGSKDSAYATRLGVIGNGWDAHANISLGSKSERTDTPSMFKGKIGYHLGGSVNAGAGKAFGYYKHYGWDQELRNTSMVKGDFSTYFLGYGSEMAVNGSDKLIASLGVKKTDININFATKAEVRNLVIPLTLGYEAKATEWLTVRGSVIQNLYGKKKNKFVTDATGNNGLNSVATLLVSGAYGATGTSTIANSTEVNSGLTLTFGQLSLDGLIGMTSTAGVDETTAGAGKKGVLSLSNLETKVGLTYKF
jgi:hypothetical protein